MQVIYRLHNKKQTVRRYDGPLSRPNYGSSGQLALILPCPTSGGWSTSNPSRDRCTGYVGLAYSRGTSCGALGYVATWSTSRMRRFRLYDGGMMAIVWSLESTAIVAFQWIKIRDSQQYFRPMGPAHFQDHLIEFDPRLTAHLFTAFFLLWKHLHSNLTGKDYSQAGVYLI